jgi:superfamily I DNA/RNA helicase
MMADGSTKAVESITVGEQVMGPDSTPRNVLELCRGRQEMVRIAPVKGEPWFVNLDHVLTLQLSGWRYESRGLGAALDLTVRDYLRQGDTFRKDAKLIRAAVDFPRTTEPLPIDAYFLGALLGDGSFCGSSPQISKPDAFIWELAAEQARVFGLSVTTQISYNGCPTHSLTTGTHRGPHGRNPLTQALRSLNLWGRCGAQKFIPDVYKRGSRETRAALVAGLIDTDGSMQNGVCDFINVSKTLVDDFVFCCRSLGLSAYPSASLKSDQNGAEGLYWRCCVSGDLTQLPLRRVRAEPRAQIKNVLRTGFSVEKTGVEEDYFGFRLDGDQRYLLGDFTVTHNSGKTTLLVGRALELAMEGVHPAGIVTLAFNKNAKETLQERLSAHQVTAPHANRMAYTFHGFAFDVIRRLRPELRALTSNAEEDARAESRGRQEQHLKTAYDVGNDVWNALGCRSKDKDTRPTWCDAVSLTELMSIESGARERLYDVWPKIAAPENKEALLLKLRSLELSEVTEPMLQALAAFMGPFLRARKHERGIDFSDMLLLLDFYTHATASTNEQTRAFHQTVRARLASIEHLQVDESQDGNELRWRLAKAVAAMPTNKSVMAVGDLRQSITGFAGAQPQLFKDWYDGATHRFDLPRNYRSASKIVRAGNLVAAGEDWNVGGDSIAARKDLGAGDVTVGAIGPLSIGLQIAEGIDNGRFTPQQVTVLARTKAVLEVVAFAIRARGIRVQVRGGGNAWGGVDGKLVLAYLAFSEGLAYDVTAFHRAINSPYRYVSAKKAREWLFGEPAPVSPAKLALQTLRRDADNEYPPAQAVLEAYLELRSSSWERRCELIENWLMEKLQAEADENPSAPGPKSDKAEFQRSLCSIAKSAQSLESLLIVIAAEADEKKPTEEEKAKTVTLSTIHRAKGDQWHTVYLTGVREGIFPHALSVSEEELAEELRLLYVAVTRPVKELIIDVTPERGSRFQHKLDALRTLNEGAYEGPEEGPPDDDDDDPDGGGGSGGGSGGSNEDEGDEDAGEDAERQATNDGGVNPGRDGEASSAREASSASRARARDESIQRAVDEALRAAAAVTASGRAAAGPSSPPGAPCVPCAPVQPCAPGSTSTSRAAGAQYAPTPNLPLPAPGAAPHPGPVAPVAPHLTEAPPPTKRTQTGIVKAFKADLKRARRLGNENPPDTSGTRPGDSSTRYVPVSIEAMRELLGPHEFIEDPQLEPRARQKVLSLTFVDGERLAVYTSIPRSSEDARDAGEDSIKVMRLSREGRPLAKAQPRTYRTQNWRENLLKRLLALVGVE